MMRSRASQIETIPNASPSGTAASRVCRHGLPATAFIILVALPLLGADPAGGPAAGAPAPSFPERVDRAVSDAVEWLKGQQRPYGGWLTRVRGGDVLASLALLAAAPEAEKRCVDRALSRIRKEYRKEDADRPSGTYITSLLMMVLAEGAGGRPPAREADGRYARRSPHPVKLTEDDREWMEELAGRLAETERDGAWNYGDPSLPRRIDHSNTQFAYLGLHAARRCGVSVSQDLFLRGADHFLGSQEPTGSPVRPERSGDDPGVETKSAASLGRDRGWGYLGPKEGSFGSCPPMTAAAVASLVVCREQLRGWPFANRISADMEESIRDGFASLKEHHRPKGTRCHYELYSVERACDLAGVSDLGGRDWYREGADLLLDQQSPSGAWERGRYGPVIDTSFALLFLVRATPGAVAPTEATPR